MLACLEFVSLLLLIIIILVIHYHGYVYEVAHGGSSMGAVLYSNIQNYHLFLKFNFCNSPKAVLFPPFV